MIFDGKQLAQKILAELKTETAPWPQKPGLAVVSFGEKKENSSYILQKKKTAEFLGFDFDHYHYATADFPQARAYLNKIVKMQKISAVVVQLPLPAGLNYSILNLIPPEKDPDILSDKAVGMFFNGRSLVEPPTSSAIFRILKEADIAIKNKRVVLWGYGRLVGRFLVPMLIKAGAILAIIEKDTLPQEAHEISSDCDIVITATGQSRFLTGDMLKEGAVVIDVGFSILDGRITGDVDLDSVKDRVSLVTPVPGGVGPVGVAELFGNVARLLKLSNKK